MKFIIEGLSIIGSEVYIPNNYKLFDEEKSGFTQDPESSAKLKQVMGYNKHHLLNHSNSFTSFAKVALDNFFSHNHIAPQVIDALVVVSQSPDHFMPNNSSIIHGLFNFKEDCYCIDISDGCTGYIRGLCESGQILSTSNARYVLLVAGDILSKKVSPQDRNSYPLIGDAISITLVARSSIEEAIFEFKANGKQSNAIAIPAGGYAIPSSAKTSELIQDEEGNIRSQDHLVMNGRDVFTFTQTVVIDFVSKFVSENFSDQNLDFVFSHQPNKFILERIKKRLGLAEGQMVTDVVSEYGNSSSATIPLAMYQQNKTHSLIDNNFSCLMIGFGVGLGWAGLKLKSESLKFCDLYHVEV